MSRLEDLRQSLLKMSPDELRDHVRKIRNDRRIVKETPKKRKAKAHETQKRTKRATDLFAKLSPADRAALLAELEREA